MNEIILMVGSFLMLVIAIIREEASFLAACFILAFIGLAMAIGKL